MSENLLDLGYIRVRLLHILLGVLNVALLQRSLREHQFIARHLLWHSDVHPRLLRQRRDARVHFIIARLKLVELLVLQSRELRDGCDCLPCGLLRRTMVRLRG